MKLDFLADEARALAGALQKHLHKRKFKMAIGKPLWPDAGYVPHMTSLQGGCPVLFELQAGGQYLDLFKNFVRHVAGRRTHCEIFLVTYSENAITGTDLKDLKADGVGLLLVDVRGVIACHLEARNPALAANIDPNLKFGNSAVRAEVEGAMGKFNAVNRVDGLKDMCEIFEREVLKLGLKAIAKGNLTLSKPDFEKQDLSGHINTLASSNAHVQGKKVTIDENLKNDLHSFRGARNLLNHPPKGKAVVIKKQRQMLDRMLTGTRLVCELVESQRKIK